MGLHRWRCRTIWGGNNQHPKHAGYLTSGLAVLFPLSRIIESINQETENLCLRLHELVVTLRDDLSIGSRCPWAGGDRGGICASEYPTIPDGSDGSANPCIIVALNRSATNPKLPFRGKSRSYHGAIALISKMSEWIGRMTIANMQRGDRRERRILTRDRSM